MPTVMTDKHIRAARPREKQYEIADAKTQGLTLRVLPSGVKTWSFRYRIGRRWGRVSLGPFPAVSLRDARDQGREHLGAVKKGRDPSQEKREKALAETFGELANLYIEQYAKPRKRSWKEDLRKIKVEVPKGWKNRRASEITRRDVREVIEAKALASPLAANRLRALLHTLFAFAVEREIVSFNPVAGTPRPIDERQFQRQRVLTEDEIRTFWKATEPTGEPDTMPPAMSAFWRLHLVTAQRLGEVNTMRWKDLDHENKMWTIPPERTKNKLQHRVPLSDLAIEIITGVEQYNEYVVAGARGKRQQAEAARLISLDDFRGHDLRRTAASFMAAAGIPRHHIGRVLNHAERGVTAIYDRHSYDREKRIALERWARKLRVIVERGEGGEVVPFATG